MTIKEKKTLTILGIILVILGLGVGTYLVVQRLAVTDQPVAPTAPESRPRAAEWIGGESCVGTFTIPIPTATASPTSTPTPTPSPTMTPTNSPTPTNTPTPTSTPGLTATATPTQGSGGNLEATPTSTITPTTVSGFGGITVSVTSTPTATLAQLPEAGISLPTLGVIGGGVVLVLLGILLAL